MFFLINDSSRDDYSAKILRLNEVPNIQIKGMEIFGYFDLITGNVGLIGASINSGLSLLKSIETKMWVNSNSDNHYQKAAIVNHHRELNRFDILPIVT